MLPSFTSIIKYFLKSVTFYYLGMYIFYTSDHKFGTCSMILKDYWKGHCIIRVIMWGIFCLSVAADIRKNRHWPFFFFGHQFLLMFMVFNVWPRTTLLPVSPLEAKRLNPPALYSLHFSSSQALICTETSRVLQKVGGSGLKICICKKFPNDADVSDQELHFEDHCGFH